jgi:hypothetical protein
MRLFSLENRCVPTVFTVTTLADAGPGSFRQAILDANANVGPDTINFNVGTGPIAILPLTQLDTITDAVVIDGTTQPGFASAPIVQIDGGSAPTGTNGLVINASNVTVRGLIVNKFAGDGIQVVGPITDVGFFGNYIGLDPAGAGGKGNGASGLAIFPLSGVPSTITVGGASLADRNFVGANGQNGIYVGQGVSGVTITNNYLGLDVAGVLDAGNNGSGVLCDLGANNVTITNNKIAGNGGDGVALNASFNVTISGNWAGLAVDGKTAVRNDFSGVAMFNGSTSVTVTNNVLSGNGTGVYIGNAITTGNAITNNLIGTDTTGLAAVPSDFRGLWFDGSTNNEAKGNTVAATSTKFGDGNGIVISGASGTGNVVSGNKVGLGSDGLTPLGNALTGIILFGGANDNDIVDNVVGANGSNGIGFFDEGTVNNQVSGNRVGVGSDGTTARGNTGAGIFIGNKAGSTLVGDNTGPGSNLIANNGAAGIAVESTSSGNSFRQNRIFNNGGLGIDLNNDGVTLNDPLDPDLGANTLLNFPVITAFTPAAASTVGGTYNGLANLTFELQFFASAVADPTGFGEGARYLGSTTITTDVNGDASFSGVALGSAVAGEVVTATAIETLTLNTSEFSKAFPFVAVPPAKVSGVVINGGAAQRSRVTTLEVTFDQALTFPANPADAFSLLRQGNNAVVNLAAAVSGGGTAVTLTFTGGSVDANSLADGRYTLTIDASKVSNGNGDLDGDGNGSPGGNFVLVGAPGTAPGLFRNFGDADGDGDVDAQDFGAFRAAFGGANNTFDFDNDGDVDAQDFGQFRSRFGSSV